MMADWCPGEKRTEVSVEVIRPETASRMRRWGASKWELLLAINKTRDYLEFGKENYSSQRPQFKAESVTGEGLSFSFQLHTVCGQPM